MNSAPDPVQVPRRVSDFHSTAPSANDDHPDHSGKDEESTEDILMERLDGDEDDEDIIELDPQDQDEILRNFQTQCTRTQPSFSDTEEDDDQESEEEQASLEPKSNDADLDVFQDDAAASQAENSVTLVSQSDSSRDTSVAAQQQQDSARDDSLEERKTASLTTEDEFDKDSRWDDDDFCKLAGSLAEAAEKSTRKRAAFPPAGIDGPKLPSRASTNAGERRQLFREKSKRQKKTVEKPPDQQTLTQMLATVDLKPCDKADPPMKDTEQRVFTKSKVCLEAGDTYLSKSGEQVTIVKFFDLNKKKRMAQVKTVVDLGTTYIGRKQADPISSPDSSRPTYVTIPETIPITDIRSRVDEESVIKPPALIYEDHSLSGGPVGFTYRFADNPLEELPSEPKIKILDLFAGCGGMSEGMKLAGCPVAYAVEIDSLAAASLEINHYKDGTKVIKEDVESFLKKCQNNSKLYPGQNFFDHIHASPPCQGFSGANRNGGKNDKRNNGMVFVFVKVIKYHMPKTFCFENVMGILENREANPLDTECSKSNKNYLQEMVAKLILLGYQVRVCVLDSSHYGDPQSRKRVFVLGARTGYRLPCIPKPTHGKGLKPLRTPRDTLQQLEDITPAAGLLCLPNGDEIYDHEKEAPKSESVQLKADEPAVTVRTHNGMKHYKLDRVLTVRERACLQSFPLDYKFCGTSSQISRQIGNAVPLKMATAVAKSVLACHGYKYDG